jgi:hypothetical protein
LALQIGAGERVNLHIFLLGQHPTGILVIAGVNNHDGRGGRNRPVHTRGEFS